MIYMDYDKETGAIKGFYSPEFHGENIPEGCIQITKEKHAFYLTNGGRYKIDIVTLEDIRMPDPEPPIKSPTNDDLQKQIFDLTTMLVEGGIV